MHGEMEGVLGKVRLVDGGTWWCGVSRTSSAEACSNMDLISFASCLIKASLIADLPNLLLS